jgi:hypothetical protein
LPNEQPGPSVTTWLGLSVTSFWSSSIWTTPSEMFQPPSSAICSRVIVGYDQR